jgi:hypothetical protein
MEEKMKKFFAKTISLFFIAGLLGANAFADDIRLGRPGYGGNGCPNGSASATLSPDQKSLSIIFDEFMVEAGGSTRRNVARKSCNIAIPVHVPQGLSISIISVDYRGFNSLPRRAMARFKAEYFFAGRRGPRYSRTFRGPLDDDYTITNRFPISAITWSRCGQDVNLRVNSSMMVRNSDRRNEALSTVDSADFSAGIIYRLSWKRC